MKIIKYDNIKYEGEKAVLEVGGMEVDSIFLPDLVEKYIKEINASNSELKYKEVDLEI